MEKSKSFFKSSDSSDKRFRKPLGIKRDTKPASDKQCKDALNAGIQDATEKKLDVRELKDKANVVSNWIEKQGSSSAEEKNQLDTLKKSVHDTFTKYKAAKLMRGDSSSATQAFRDATQKYFQYVQDNIISKSSDNQSSKQIVKDIIEDKSDLERAKQGFEKFKDAYNAGNDDWKKFFIEREDGGLKAMFLELKPCMLTEKEGFSEEYIKKLKKHSKEDINVLGLNPSGDVSLDNTYLVFSKNNVKRMLPKYKEYFPGYTSDLDVSSYLSSLNLGRIPETKEDSKLHDIQQGLLFGYEPHSVKNMLNTIVYVMLFSGLSKLITRSFAP